jgi:site-specific DNA recombinase
MKLLGAVRLSDLTEETTSPARQREAITHTAIARADTLTEIVEDLDVSGAVSPFDREGLGPWLSQPAKIRQWDGLVVHKLDRLTRSLDDFAHLVKWCNVNGKTIISISESLDLSTSHGRMLANILITFAEFERERISERRREAAVKLRQIGRWGGGRIPYGYKPRNMGGGWELVPDPEAVKVVKRMVDETVKGTSANELARRFMTEKVQAPQGKDWHAQGIIRILRNPALRGYVTTAKSHEKPQIVRDSEGMPIKRTPILDDVTWTRLQRALDAASQQKSGVRRDASPFLGVAVCGECGSALHAFRFTRRERKYAYYRCAGRAKRTCNAAQIPMEDLEATIAVSFLAEFGDKPMLERIEHEGDDHSRELAEVGQQIADLTAERFVRQVIRPDYETVMANLQKEHARVKALPVGESTVEIVETGITHGQHWVGLDMAGRGSFLADLGLRVLASRRDGEVVIMWTPAEGETDHRVYVSVLPA